MILKRKNLCSPEILADCLVGEEEEAAPPPGPVAAAAAGLTNSGLMTSDVMGLVTNLGVGMGEQLDTGGPPLPPLPPAELKMPLDPFPPMPE